MGRKKAKASGKPKRKASPSRKAAAGGYQAVKVRAARRAAQMSEAGRDIGKLPPIEDPERRAAACALFRAFCEIYHAETFYLPWAPDHLKVIAKIEKAVVEGGLFGLAMPRGGGKTSLCEIGCEWAILGGRRPFVALIGADATAAEEMLGSIQLDFETNDLLLADFPEVLFAVHALERISNRCKGQTCMGHATYIEWTAKHIVLPSIPAEILEELGVAEANGCGAIIKTAGLLGRVRGMKHKRLADRRPLRPSLVLVDDPQTDATAASITQCDSRLKVLTRGIIKMAAPGETICAFMPCTVIQPGDMADQILNRDEHPEWQGARMKMVYAFPEREDLWEEYAELYRAGLAAGNIAAATRFYKKNRKAMDAGAEVAWPENYEPDELSGIHHAMNMRIKDEAGFWAECQNEPLAEENEAVRVLDADEVAAKLNNMPRARIPAGCNLVTAFVDVHDRLLYWLVCSWESNFTGYVIDYGVYPEQVRRHFAMRNIQRTLRRVHQGMGVEGAIYAALETLVGSLLGREWMRDDGAVLRIDQLLIDQGYQTDTIHQFCRQTPHAAIIMPSRGASIRASQKPISEYNRKRGDKIGHNWWIPSVKGKRVLRHVEIDTNYWKSFVHERLATAMGDKGCLSLFGDKPTIHRLFAEHLTAEYYIQTEGRGRVVNEWQERPHRPDNHWLDGLVGCAAAASMRGIVLPGLPGGPLVSGGARKKISLAQLQARKGGKR